MQILVHLIFSATIGGWGLSYLLRPKAQDSYIICPRSSSYYMAEKGLQPRYLTLKPCPNQAPELSHAIFSLILTNVENEASIKTMPVRPDKYSILAAHLNLDMIVAALLDSVTWNSGLWKSWILHFDNSPTHFNFPHSPVFYFTWVLALCSSGQGYCLSLVPALSPLILLQSDPPWPLRSDIVPLQLGPLWLSQDPQEKSKGLGFILKILSNVFATIIKILIIKQLISTQSLLYAHQCQYITLLNPQMALWGRL